MKRAKILLIFGLLIVDASVVQATKPIELVRGPTVSKEVVNLNMQAQGQMMKGDLANAERSVQLAMQKDPTLWLTYFTRARVFSRERKYDLTIKDCN